jgi:hypothetical protein
MEPVVRKDVPFQLSIGALRKPLSIDEDFEDEFREIYDECMRIARPKYMHRRVDVRREDARTLVGGEAFQSRIMWTNFEGVSNAYAYAATCGRELYEYAMATADPLARYWIDSISERILYQASARCFGEIKELAGSDNVSSMNPGSLSDFPITEQVPLFRMLGDVFGEIGIHLTETCLMLPYKSLSGIYFVSGKEYVNCALCQRANCPNRRAEFDEMIYQATFSL